MHKKSPRLNTQFPNTRSEKRKIPAQNDRAATNPTQNPSTYIVVSFQFTTNLFFPAQPTLSRSLLQKFPVYRFLTARVRINLDTQPLKTSLVTLPKLNLAGDHTVTWHEEVFLAPRMPSYGVVPGEAQVKKRQGYQTSFQFCIVPS